MVRHENHYVSRILARTITRHAEQFTTFTECIGNIGLSAVWLQCHDGSIQSALRHVCAKIELDACRAAEVDDRNMIVEQSDICCLVNQV